MICAPGWCARAEKRVNALVPSRVQTAQDVSFANVQTLFQALCGRQSCSPTAAEPSHRQSVSVHGEGVTQRALYSRLTLRLTARKKTDLILQI